MDHDNAKKYKCKLCGKYFSDSEMSDEHYPAHSTGNDDIVTLDFKKMIDSFFIHGNTARNNQKDGRRRIH